MKKIMITLTIAIMSTVANAQHDHSAQAGQASTQQTEPMFKDKTINTAYSNYILLKNALVDSDQATAKSASAALEQSLNDVKNGTKALAEAKKATSASTLADQRKAFVTLSTEMTSLVKGAELTMGVVYLEFCPMANNNSGAYWLSNEREIRNPYFGNMMLKCGSVKETIQ